MNNNRPFALTSSASSGIDKLVLTSQAFIVRDASKTGLQVKHGFTDLATGEQNNPYLFTDKTGRKVEGVSAFLNTEQYQLNINKYGLQVVFNPSKAYHPYELCKDIPTLQKRVETLSKDLYDKGIRLDIEQANISRIDLAKNAEMKHSCIAYRPIMSGLNIPYSKRCAMYPDGHSSNNNKFCFNAYNKGKELRLNDINLIDHDRLMRFELQYKGTQSVGKKAGISTLSSIYEAGHEYLNNLYKETLSQDVFKAGQSNQLQFSYIDIKELLQMLKAQHGKNFMSVFYRFYGTERLINELASIEQCAALFKELFSRNIATKHIKYLQASMNFQAGLKKTSGIGKLYKELYYKFAA